MRLPHQEWIAGLSATGGTLLAVVEGSDEWTAKAYSAIGACAVIVAGGILLLGRIDKAWMERRKVWEDFNKGSLTKQLTETNESLAKMRVSLHEANNISHAALLENTSLHEDMGKLRQQFIDIAGNLQNVQKRLVECEDDRISLHRQLGEIRTTAANNEKRLDTLEESGEMRVVKPEE